MDDKLDLRSERFLLNRTYDLLDSKWNVYIVYALGEGVCRFGELRRLFPRISRVTLTRCLQKLEQNGLVDRVEYPAPPLKTEYSLTPLGLRVYPLIVQLVSWGES